MEVVGNFMKGIMRGISSMIRLAFIGGLAAGTFLRDIVTKKTDNPES